MNKVLFVVFVFLQSTFLACCNGCSQSPPASHNKDYKYKVPMKSVADTVSKISEEKPVETSIGSSSYSSGHSKTKYDNMRGFDPASEDDMDEFIQFAKANKNLTFLVTRIGCGIAGFRDNEISPLFEKAHDVENIVLPPGW